MLELGVLVSGSGTNLQAILDAIARGELAARVRVVVSNKPAVAALDRAARAGIPSGSGSARGSRSRAAASCGRAARCAWNPRDRLPC